MSPTDRQVSLLSNSEREYVDVNEAANHLGVSPATVRNWAKSDLLTPVKVGRKVHFEFHQSIKEPPESNSYC